MYILRSLVKSYDAKFLICSFKIFAKLSISLLLLIYLLPFFDYSRFWFYSRMLGIPAKWIIKFGIEENS